jgi:hypothetical protein
MIIPVLLFSTFMPVAANAATPPPFLGDQFTYEWGNTAGAFPSNWINQGWNGFPETTPCPAQCYYGTSGATMERFKTEVIDVHPAVVHILVGADDADINTDAYQLEAWPEYLSNIQTMVSLAHEAGIHVILGIEVSQLISLIVAGS